MTAAEIALAALTPAERLRIISMREASHLSGLSIDSLERRHGSKIIKLSPRRKGMRLADALQLPAE
jgi:hypothetical protein